MRPVDFLRDVDFLRPVDFRAVDFLRPVDLRVEVDLRPVDLRDVDLAVDFFRADDLRLVVFFAAKGTSIYAPTRSHRSVIRSQRRATSAFQRYI